MNEKKIDVLMSEMTAIRNEINTTKETIHSILNFFFILIGIEVSLLIAAWSSSVDLSNIMVRFLVLSIPLLFMCLSMYHSECVMRIHNYIEYIDFDIRNKIQELLGEPLLNTRSKIPTKSIIGVFKSSPLEAKLGYLSKLGIKIMSMLFPLLFYVYIVYYQQIDILLIERIMFAVDIGFIVTLFFMQHD